MLIGFKTATPLCKQVDNAINTVCGPSFRRPVWNHNTDPHKAQSLNTKLSSSRESIQGNRELGKSLGERPALGGPSVLSSRRPVLTAMLSGPPSRLSRACPYSPVLQGKDVDVRSTARRANLCRSPIMAFVATSHRNGRCGGVESRGYAKHRRLSRQHAYCLGRHDNAHNAIEDFIISDSLGYIVRPEPVPM